MSVDIKPTQLREIADSLFDARATRSPIPPITDTHPGLSVEDAYQIQELNTVRRLAAGEKIVGRKIGLTSPAVQAQLGVSEPDFGMIWDVEAVAPCEVVKMAELMQPKVEAEIAFVLSRAISDPSASLSDIAECVDYAVAAVEIVDSAIEAWKITLADTVADNASGAKFQLGHDRKKLSELDLHLGGMELVQNGRQVSVGVSAACLGHPLKAVHWLAQKMIDVGRPLEAGDIILSGALGPMATVQAGDSFTTHIQGFEPLQLFFE